MKEKIREILLASGASAVGFARAGKVDDTCHSSYSQWIEEGNHGEMAYLERHLILKTNTDNVLADARTVICLAYSYIPEEWRSSELPLIASYAYGDDYHNVLRDILRPYIKNFTETFGGNWRICIDSVPLSERYWAIKSGIGKRGLNGSVIVEGCGGMCFLVEILTTLEIEPDNPSEIRSDSFSLISCSQCGECVVQCPAKALKGDGSVLAKSCINYLTIEKKGEWNENEKKILHGGNGYLYGCDICLRVCPHNQNLIPSGIKPFGLTEEIRNLTSEKIIRMDKEEFKRLFKKSPLLYAGYERLRANAEFLVGKPSKKSHDLE